MADIQQLLVRIDASSESLRRELARADGAVSNTQRSIDTRLGAIDSRFARLGTTIGSVGRSFVGALGPLAGALSARQVIAYADAWQNVQGRLKLVTTDTDNLADTTERLFGIAQETRTSFDSVADLYARLARSTQQLGLSQQDLLTLTESINQAVVVSGASAQEASAGLIQLGQAFASGALRGDELRSVLEQMPRVAQAIADGLGVTIGQLRAMGTAGQLTGRQVATALLGQAAKIRSEFAAMPTTVGQSLIKVENSFERLIGHLNESSGASRQLAEVLGSLSEALASSDFEADVERTLGALIETATQAAAAIKNLMELLSRLPGVASALQGMTDPGNAARELEGLNSALQRFGSALDAARRAAATGGPVDIMRAFLGDIDPAAELENVNNEIALALKRRLELLDEGYSHANSLALRKQQEFIDSLKAEQARLTEVLGRQQIDVAMQGLQLPQGTGARLSGALERITAEPKPKRPTAPEPPNRLDQELQKLQRQAALLQDMRLTQQQISAIMGQEFVSAGNNVTAFKALGDAQRQRLVTALELVDAAEKQHALYTEQLQTQRKQVAQEMPTADLRAAAEAAAQLDLHTENIRTPAEFEAFVRTLPKNLQSALQVAVELDRVQSDRQVSQNLSDQLSQLQLANDAGGELTEQTRARQQILEIELSTHREITAEQRSQIQAIQQQITLQENIAQRAQIRQQTAQTRLALQQRTDPGNVISNQLIGVDTTASRVQAQLLELQQQHPGVDVQKEFGPAIQQQEEYATKLALTNTLMTSLSDSAAQLGTTLLFEGADEAGQQLIKMLIQMAIQLAANLAIAAALNALLGGGPAAAGAGAGGLTPTAALGTGAFGLLGHAATGGPVRANEPIVVGEKGPEVYVPSGGGQARMIGTHGQEVIIPRAQGEIIPNDKIRALAAGTAAGAAAGMLPALSPAATPPPQPANSNRAHVEFKIIDQRGAGAPPIEVSQQQGPDGRQTMVAVVRGGLSEMQRTGELTTFLRRNYTVGARPR